MSKLIVEKPKEVSWDEIMRLMYAKKTFIVLEDGTVITNEDIDKIDLKNAEDYGIIHCG